VGPLVVVVVRALLHSGIIPPLNQETKKFRLRKVKGIADFTVINFCFWNVDLFP